jgi:integrase
MVDRGASVNHMDQGNSGGEREETRYELGRFNRPSAGFPRGQYCVYVREPDQEKRRFGLKVSLDRPESEGIAALNDWARRRRAALFVQRGSTIKNLWDLYIAEKKAEGRIKYVRDCTWTWNANLGPTFNPLTAADLVEPMEVRGEMRTICHKYAAERHAAGIRRASIWTELNLLRTVINWGADETRKYVPKVKVFVPRKAKSRQNKLEPNDYIKVYRAASEPHVKLFLLLAICTTQRMSAILELAWDRVSLEKRMIDFQIDRDQEDILDSSGKKARAKVDMNEILYLALVEQKRHARTPFVIEYNGKPIKSVRRALYRAFNKAGIKGQFLGAHALRHAGATWLADAGTDMRVIQRLTGHEDIRTTEIIYADHSRGYLKGAVDFLDELISSESESGDATFEPATLDAAGAKRAK